MYFVFLTLVGIISGILGGMGMGGGTLLIPLLTLFFGFNQKLAQGTNLIAFSLMAIIIIFIHIKNKLINVKTGLLFALFSLPASILGAVLAGIIKEGVLKRFYGGLLIVIAIFQVVCLLKSKKNI